MFDFLADLEFGKTVTAHGKEWDTLKRLHTRTERDGEGHHRVTGNYWLAVKKGATLPATPQVIYEEIERNK
jgi:hypothetical protein